MRENSGLDISSYLKIVESTDPSDSFLMNLASQLPFDSASAVGLMTEIECLNVETRGVVTHMTNNKGITREMNMAQRDLPTETDKDKYINNIHNLRPRPNSDADKKIPKKTNT